ncbi:MAG: IS110 family transposase [Rhodospirillales bacterium]|nr:IS110 family transposase [Rhodospirillales bacterium]
MSRRPDPAAPTGAEATTLYVAIEISRKSWVVGLKSPLGEKIGLHTLAAADVASLKGLLEQHRSRAEQSLGRGVEVRVCYEAGYEGFWLARWLQQAMGLETVVLDPASLLVNRKAKQRKTDRIDARKMVRALLAYDRGDAAVLSRVRVPSIEEEDRKRLLRERQRLVKERTALTNTIKGLLKLHGVFGLEPRAHDFDVAFAAATTACGEPFPPQAGQEIERLAERLGLVMRQIEAIEAERLGLVMRQIEAIEAERDAADAPHRAAAGAGGGARADALIAALAQLKGIGANDATLLTHEVFYREFRNRRELAGWAGLAPTPWASGDVERDQGIGRDGPAWIRAQLVQMAWRWVRFQPGSALSQWFQARTDGARGRIRRVMIVALARKLLIALWRYASTGLVPTGARVA